jgi:Cupin
MDVLSEVLRVVKLDGAVFYNAEFSSPWSFRSPPSRTLAPYLPSPTGHVILFHLLTEGRGYRDLSSWRRTHHGKRPPRQDGGQR